jgi:hypothetical protein
MIVAAIYVSLLAAIAAFWLVRQDLAAKPWLEQGVIGDSGGPGEGKAPRVGLWLFLAVVGALFALLASAYVMRMDSPDWRYPPIPRLLWVNTGVLIASSLALQASVFTARRNEAARARFWLLTGAVAAVAFLAGQLLAWREFASGRRSRRPHRDRRSRPRRHSRPARAIRDRALRRLLALSVGRLADPVRFADRLGRGNCRHLPRADRLRRAHDEPWETST